MKVGQKLGLTLAGALIAGSVCQAQFRSSGVLWLDFDMKNIPEPKEREASYYDAFFEGQIIDGLKQQMDIPRWLRLATGHPKQASNVNVLDEVPDSSWYTNRHRLHRMTEDELKRGPNKGTPPDFADGVITKAKTSGVTPGLEIKDATGQAYLVKFDGVTYPNLQSSAEVISTKILYAAGYNVPENYIAYIDPNSLRIRDHVEIKDAKTRKKRPLTRADLDEMLQRVAKTPEGRCRVLASKILSGKSKGPFALSGFRSDDPNDLIPHENRRELRALRIISSWINNWDIRDGQSLDMYVEEEGRKFLRHYLIDFGSSLGAGRDPTEYFHGHEYFLDGKSIMQEIATLGFHESPDEKQSTIISPEVGSFTADDFEPGSWKSTFPSVAFSNLTDLDAFWATRVILSFTEDDLRNIVKTAELSPQSSDYILRTLLERRDKLVHYWLSKTDALSDFLVKPTTEGIELAFHDLLIEHKLTDSTSNTYSYQVKGSHYTSTKKSSNRPEITIDREELGRAIARSNGERAVEVTIWATRGNSTSSPVSIFFDWSPNRDRLAIRKIARG